MKNSENPSLGAGVYYETSVDYNSFDNRRRTKYVGHVPTKLNFGILFGPNTDVTLSGDVYYIFWEEVSPNYQNQIEIALSGFYRLLNNFYVSAGIFHTDRVYNAVDPSFDLNRLNANYLLAGIAFQYNQIILDLVVADSHFSSDPWRRQTIIKSALGFQF
jgi:hypothetical protein